MGGQNDHHPPLHSGLSSSYNLFLDAVLFTQFVHEITKGKAKEEMWSSVTYLFFMSTSLIDRKNQQVRQGIA